MTSLGAYKDFVPVFILIFLAWEALGDPGNRTGVLDWRVVAENTTRGSLNPTRKTRMLIHSRHGL